MKKPVEPNSIGRPFKRSANANIYEDPRGAETFNGVGGPVGDPNQGNLFRLPVNHDNPLYVPQGAIAGSRALYEPTANEMDMDIERVEADLQTTGGRIIRQGRAAGLDTSMTQATDTQIEEWLASGDPEQEQMARYALAARPRNNPDTVVEEDYFEALYREYIGDPDFNVEDLNESDRQSYEIFFQKLYDSAVRDQVIQTAISDLLTRWEGRNWLANAWDYLEMVIPTVVTTQLGATMPMGNDFWSGEALEDTYSWLATLDIDEFTRNVRLITEDLGARNPSLAYAFLNGLYGFGTEDEGMWNAQVLLDVPVLGAARLASRAGIGGVRLTRALNAAGITPQQILTQGARTLGQPVVNAAENLGRLRRTLSRAGLQRARQDINAGMGRIREAAIEELAKDPIRIVRGDNVFARGANRAATTGAALVQVARRAFGASNPFQYFGSSVRSVTQGSVFSAARSVTTWLSDAISAMPVQRMARLTDQGSIAGLRNVYDNVLRQMGKIREASMVRVERLIAGDDKWDTFAAIRPKGRKIPEGTEAANVEWVNIHYVRHGREQFDTAADAANYARNRLGFKGKKGDLRDWSTWKDPHTGKYEIVQTQAIDEMSGRVRSRDIFDQSGNVRPEALSQSPLIPGLRRLMGYANWLSGVNRGLTTAMQHATSAFSKNLGEIIKPLTRLAKPELRALTRFMRHMQDNHGRYFGMLDKKYVGSYEFVDEWTNYYGAPPSKRIVGAYESWLRMDQTIWSTFNTALYNAKMRQGRKMFTFEGQTVEGRYVAVEDVAFHDGKGGASTPDFITIIDNNGKARSVRWDTATQADRKTIMDAINDGEMDVIQVLDHRGDQLRRGALQNNPNVPDFVVTKKYEVNPLPLEQLEFPKGGYNISAARYQVRLARKQNAPNGQILALDEVAISGARSVKEANQIIADLQQARKMFDDAVKGNGNYTPVRNFINKNLPHIDADDLIKRFESNELRFDGNLLKVTETGQTVRGRFPNDFKNTKALTDDLYGGRMIDEEVLYDMGPEDWIDPLRSMQKNMKAALHTVHGADTMTALAERFVSEFREILTGASPKLLDRNPVAVLLEADKYIDPGATNRAMVTRAKQLRWAARDLIGSPGEWVRQVRNAELALADTVFDIGRKVFTDKAASQLAHHLSAGTIGSIDNAMVFMRAMAFKMNLGLFNIRQVLKQAQTAVVIASLSPGNALQSTVGGMLMGAVVAMGYKNRAVIEAIAKRAGAIGFKADDFLEAFDWIQDSGIVFIKGEHALKDRWMDARIGRSRTGTFFLEHGDIPFKMGEGYIRAAAMIAAHREFRKKHPNRPFDRSARQEQMARVNDLMVNMTHNANAVWQKGPTAFFAQFLTYQIRLWEMMLGKRLNPAERVRLVLGQSLMYGVPTGVGGTLAGFWPWADDHYRDLARDNPEELTDPSAGGTLYRQGILGMLSFLATGRETNAGTYYGAQGLETLREIFVMDKPFTDWFFGASGSVLANVWNASFPARAFIVGALNPWDDIHWSDYRMAIESVMDTLKNIASVDAATRGWYMLNHLQYIRRNGEEPLQAEFGGQGQAANQALGPSEAWMFAAFGVSPQIMDSMYHLNYTNQDYLERQQPLIDSMKAQFRDIRRLMRNPDLSQEDMRERINYHVTIIRSLRTMGNFTESQMATLAAEIYAGYDETVDALLMELANSENSVMGMEQATAAARAWQENNPSAARRQVDRIQSGEVTNPLRQY